MLLITISHTIVNIILITNIIANSLIMLSFPPVNLWLLSQKSHFPHIYIAIAHITIHNNDNNTILINSNVKAPNPSPFDSSFPSPLLCNNNGRISSNPPMISPNVVSYIF